MGTTTKVKRSGSDKQSFAPAPFVLADFRAHRSGALIGFASIVLPGGIVVEGISLYAKGDARWANPPRKPQISRDGHLERDEQGKPLYEPTIGFASAAAKQAWSSAVVRAVEAAHPDAFVPADGEGGA